MTVIQIDRRELAFRNGMKLFVDGRPCPDNVWSDDEWAGVLNEGQARWLGWMLGRARKLLHEMRHADAVRDYIEHGIDLPPDFS